VIDVLKCRVHINDAEGRICPPPREDTHDPRDLSETYCPVCLGETPPDSDIFKEHLYKNHNGSRSKHRGNKSKHGGTGSSSSGSKKYA
jgi:hypothetical protein